MKPTAYLLAALLTITGHPTVIDGDTLAFDVRGGSDLPSARLRPALRTASGGGEAGVRVRLVGSDAPEMDTFLGKAAELALRVFIAGQPVTCVQTTPRTTYGRIIARCTLPDGRDLDRLMIDNGWSRPWN